MFCESYVDFFIITQILKNEKGVTGAAQRRNEIRESIKSFFKSINAYTLPVPSHEKEVLRNMGKSENNKNLNGEFLTKLDILKTTISEKYHSKKGINDSLLTGTRKSLHTSFIFNVYCDTQMHVIVVCTEKCLYS